MERKTRRCAVCSDEYKFCPKCQEDENKPLWYFLFCSENCFGVYGATSNFEDGKISATEAKNKLAKLDLSKMDKFGTSYKASIEKINTTSSTSIIDNTVVEDASLRVEENIIESDAVIETNENIIEEVSVEEVTLEQTDVFEDKKDKKSKKNKKNIE